MNTFIEKCVNNSAHMSQINEYVSQWHRSDSSESLHEFLGLTFNEYMEWVQNPQSLEKIIQEKKHKTV